MTPAPALLSSRSSIVPAAILRYRPAQCRQRARGFNAMPASRTRLSDLSQTSCGPADRRTVHNSCDVLRRPPRRRSSGSSALLGARMALVTAYKHVGHSVPRLHAPVSRRGQDLVDDLLSAVEKRSIPLAVGNGARALVSDANDGVIGADIETTNGERQRFLARKILLAVNGFAGNRDLVARFCPEISGAQYFGARGSTGEAVLWGEQLGAALGNIGAYQGYAAVSDPHGSLLSWTTIEKGGIIVNGAGQRFGDESAGYSGYTPNVMAQGGPCFAIFDQKIFDIAALEEEFVELANYGGIKKASTAAELAKMYSLDPVALTGTVEIFNKAARGH